MSICKVQEIKYTSFRKYVDSTSNMWPTLKTVLMANVHNAWSSCYTQRLKYNSKNSHRITLSLLLLLLQVVMASLSWVTEVHVIQKIVCRLSGITQCFWTRTLPCRRSLGALGYFNCIIYLNLFVETASRTSFAFCNFHIFFSKAVFW